MSFHAVAECQYSFFPGQEYNFERHDIGSVGSLGLPYDYESLMHYGKKTFTRNGENTLERINNPNGKLGRTGGTFSSTDKVAINALYECNRYPGMCCLHFCV